MAETASILEWAGLIEIVEDGEGREAYLLTADGERVNRMRAMTSGADVDAVLDALLAGTTPGRPARPAASPKPSSSV